MKKNILRIAIFLLTIASFGQNLEEFKKEFQNATVADFSQDDLDGMFRKYSEFLTPHSDITQFTANIKNEPIASYPLAEYKKTEEYKNTIKFLLHSKNANHRLLSYLVLASAKDASHEQVLLEKLKTETREGNLIWCGMALMYLNTNHTTALFDFLVAHENFGDSHMIPLYIKLQKDSLQNTAYNRIESDNKKAKVLAAQILSFTEKTEKTEKLLLSAVKNWDYNIKGYAIYSIKELQIGNLKEVLVPLLDSTKTRSIAIQALVNSPTKEDVDYIKELAETQKVVSKDILNGFLESKNPESVKYWLELVSRREIPEDYYFSAFQTPLLFSDELLSDVQETLRITPHISIQQYLIKALGNREDQLSQRILYTYIDKENSSVRYWAIDALKNTTDEKVIKKLIELLKDPIKREVSVTPILINNNIDTLQNTYVEIYNTSQESRDWRRSAIEYLSSFPKKEHKEIFRAIIHKENEDTFIQRNAVFGLSQLLDKESIDQIIALSEEERKGSDSNCRTYIVALSELKGEKGKKYIATFKDSDSDSVSKLVKEILDNWE
ncbi:HEAT repeat domain-containing protein [Kordia sp.]|uniref:HEAT repeat domain-containing protein n=1 Tax=Kordia sp. TaxID=1965332 RepID=UPI003D6B366A